MRRKINREDILEAGLNLIFLNGFNNTGIKDITDEVGIPKGSFYNHFKNKEAFGLELIEYYSSQNEGKIMAILNDSDKRPIERLQAYFRFMIDNFIEVSGFKKGCLLGNMCQEMADVNMDFSKAINKLMLAFRDNFEQCLLAAQQSGEVSNENDLTELAEFITNSWHGAIMRMKASRNAYPLESFYNQIFGVVLRA